MSETGMSEIVVRDNPSRSRYEIVVDGHLVGVADYELVDERVVLPHTEIDPSMRGRGLAETLVRFALEDIRGRGRSVVPSCWYVAQYIDTHPEYADLLPD